MASLLAVAGFRIADVEILWVAVTATFFVASTTMLQNDWRDRFHDARKGKTLALQRPRAFLALLCMFWVVCGSLIAVVVMQDRSVGLVLVIAALAGFVYSETQRIPLAPITIVSLASSSPAILPLAAGANPEKLLSLFLSVTFVIFAREITKDLDDQHIDSGYKWTLPLVLGGQRSRFVAFVGLAAGSIVSTGVSWITLPLALPVFVGGALLYFGESPGTSRTYIDVGIASVLLALIILG